MFKNHKEIGRFLGFVSKNSLFLFSINILSVFSSFIVGVLISRRLGVVPFGEYTTAYNFYNMFYYLPLLGLGIFVTRELAKDKTRVNKYFANVGFISLITSIICFLLICVIVFLMKYGRNTKIATYIVSLSLFPNSLILLTQAIFIAFAKARYAFFVAIAEAMVKVIFSLVALTLGYGINSLMGIQLFSKFIGSILSIYFVIRCTRSFRIEIDFNFCRNILKEFAFTFALITILGSILTKIDIIVLSGIRGITEVGWYGPASKLTWFGYTFILAITTTFFPIASKLFAVSGELFEVASRQSLKYFTAMLLPFLIVGFLVSDRLILFCFGREFMNSVIVFKILIWSIFFIGLCGFCDSILIVGNKQRQTIYTLCFSLIVSLILNISFSYRWGYIGTSIAFLLSIGTYAALEFFLVNRLMFSLHLISILGKPLLSFGFAVIFISLFQHRLNLLSLIILSELIYFFILLSSRTFTKEDIRVFRKLWQEGKVVS